jgi:putative flippase GtrA
VKQFARFLVVGVLNTLLGYCVIFALMYLAKLTPEISNIGGYAVGLATSYFLNRNYTFNSKQRHSGEVIRFLLVFFIAYAANFLALLVFIHKVGMHVAISQIVAGLVYVVASYLMNKHYVFKKPKQSG